MKQLLKFLFSLLLLLAVFWVVDFAELKRILSAITWGAVFNLSLITVALIYVSALKWGLFIESFGSKFSVWRLFRYYLVGYFFNLFMPSYVGGDLVRSFYVGKNAGQHQALSATILERYTGLMAMITLAFAFMWFNNFVTLQIEIVIFGLLLGLVVITIIALSERLLEMLDQVKLLKPIVKHLKKIQSGLKLARRNKRLLARSMALSYLYHTLTVVNIIFCAAAVGWNNPPVLDLFTLTPIMLLIIAIPVAPSALGVQEGTFYFFLQIVGATPAQALGVGLVLRAKAVILSLCGGVFYKLGEVLPKGELP